MFGLVCRSVFVCVRVVVFVGVCVCVDCVLVLVGVCEGVLVFVFV